MDNLRLVTMTLVLALGGFTLSTDYLKSSTELLNWSQANDYCINNNGSLILLNSENDWYNCIPALCSSSCFYFHWTALQLDSNGKCKPGSKWSYSGWAKWYGIEPDGCPNNPCVVVNIQGMRTRSCSEQHRALCKKDILTATNGTESSQVPAHISSTASTQATAGVTSDVKTTTQNTLLAVLTTGDPKMSTDVAPSPYNNTVVVDGSCEECCFKPNNSIRLSREELKSIIRDLKSQLAVNKKHLSVYRRKLISVYDSRPSSIAIGVVAVTILVAFVAIIVVPDLVKLVRFLNKRQKTTCPTQSNET